jgi:6-phosphogluconolactonase/glucosamine-6-phosphate isomerase/deaminase
MKPPKLIQFSDSNELIFQALELFRSLFPMLGKNQQAPAQPVPRLGKSAGLMLAGGRTPLEIYRRAAAEGLSTEATLFLSDERYVPTADPQSNYGTIFPFSPLRLGSGQATLLKIRTDLPIEEAAQAFHNDLSKLESIPLGLLGLGTDGHTASLFNLKDAALRDERLAIPVIKLEKPDRISVTPTLLNRIERIIILATGAEKKEMIQTLLNHPESIPAGVALADHPHIEIWTDQKI